MISTTPVPHEEPPLRRLVFYFLGLGTWGFGGPVVLVERMRRDLVEGRGWFAESDYKEGLALAQLAPGPLAAQLAIYLGWLRAGLVGATMVENITTFLNHLKAVKPATARTSSLRRPVVPGGVACVMRCSLGTVQSRTAQDKYRRGRGLLCAPPRNREPTSVLRGQEATRNLCQEMIEE
jgi:hypothetical protein